jgi:DnaJ domain
MATTFLLVNVFTAFLPRREPDEGDYYEFLGLATAAADDDDAAAMTLPWMERRAKASVTPEDIRKAYKQKSLQLHPDKVAQRGEDAASAARQYERVQEAYACLNDPKNRDQYHQLRCSPTYYRFVVTNPGGFLHPVALYENLQKASCVDKTRLVVLVTLFLMLSMLQPILVAAKVNQTLAGTGGLADAPWVAILTPLWIGHGLFLLLLAVLSAATRQVLLVASLLEHACWLAGEVLLAQQWDKAGASAAGNASTNWHVVSVPFYFALVLRAVASVLVVLDMIHNQMKMVSPDKLRADHPDWTDEQFMAAEDEYCIVTVDEEAVAHTVQLLAVTDEGPVTDEDLEAIRVQLSPEYQATSAILKDQSKAVMYILVFGFTFVALVASKLENQIYVSWWTVFIPIWVYLGQSILYYLLVCCCLSTGDSVLVVRRPQDDEDGGDGDEGAVDEAANAAGAGARPAPSSSANFASAEGSMKEFNERVAPATPAAAAEGNESTVGASETPPAEPTSSAVSMEGGIPAPSSTTVVPSSLAEGSDVERDPVTAREKTTSANPAPTAAPAANSDVQEEENLPHLDEDTFRAWQHAQEKAESSAMEKEAKALSACCFALFQLMIVCLIVGKLQVDYQQPDPSGYNAFWVLFPIFLVVGLVLCCCACLIYGPAYEVNSPDEDGDHPAPDVEAGQGGEGIIPLVPAPTPEATIAAANVPPVEPAVKESLPTPAPVPGNVSSDALPYGSDNGNDAAPSDEGGSNRAPSDEAIDMNDLD